MLLPLFSLTPKNRERKGEGIAQKVTQILIDLFLRLFIQKRFYTRGTVSGKRISPLDAFVHLFHDWLRSLFELRKMLIIWYTFADYTKCSAIRFSIVKYLLFTQYIHHQSKLDLVIYIKCEFHYKSHIEHKNSMGRISMTVSNI